MFALDEYLYLHPNDWRELLTAAPYFLEIKEDGDYILFKYNQILSDFSNSIVQEARGIIFRKCPFNAFKCVCRPFSKFFNYGEENAATINWEADELTVTEKIDGSLIKVWFDDGWHLSTNGTIDAAKAMLQDNSMSYEELFEKAISPYYADFYDFCNGLFTNCTYMFELVSPRNRVVIPYNETKIYFLGARSNVHGIYTLMDDIPYIDKPKAYTCYSLDEVVNIARQLDWKHEGFVVFDGVDRIKVKSPAYLMAHYARNNNVMTKERLLDVILQNEKEEFLTYAEEYKKDIEDLEKQMEEYKKGAAAAFKDLSPVLRDIRKTYAENVNNYSSNIRAFLFSAIKNIDINEYVKDWTAAQWCKALNIK